MGFCNWSTWWLCKKSTFILYTTGVARFNILLNKSLYWIFDVFGKLLPKYNSSVINKKSDIKFWFFQKDNVIFKQTYTEKQLMQSILLVKKVIPVGRASTNTSIDKLIQRRIFLKLSICSGSQFHHITTVRTSARNWINGVTELRLNFWYRFLNIYSRESLQQSAKKK